MATAAMTLATSCSSDAVVEDQQAANAIQFGVTTGNASRAASYYCNNDKPDQFNVWAKVKVGVGYKTYFEDESFVRKANAATWTIASGIERYWPNEEVSFYAVKNHDKDGAEFATVNWNDGAPTIDMTVETSAAKQQDLLYAYTKATKNVVNNKCVANLNFRHALSQVVFKAQNKNKNIYVKISEVIVANLQTNGTFTFPTTKTDQNLDSHDQTGALPTEGIGSWTLAEGENAKFAAETTTGTFGPIAVPCNKEEGGVVKAFGPVNLTNNNDKDNVDNSLIVLPQTLNKWDHTAAPSTTGAYFKVKCLIKNVAKGDGLAATKDDVTLYNGDIYIPVDIKWEVGKKYIYTFVFSEKGHGGYDEKGNDVLIPIEFNVTVDDFAKGTETNVDADNGNQKENNGNA